MRKVSTAVKSSMPCPTGSPTRGVISSTTKGVAKKVAKMAVKTKTTAVKTKTTAVKTKTTAIKSKKSPTKRLSPEKILSRNEKIQSLYSTGKYSIRALAAKIGMSKSRVGEIV